jgi:hypothetical protein
VRRLLAGAACVGLGLLLAGCGGGKSARARVSAYFSQVNAIEHRMTTRMSDADIAFRRFSVQGMTPKVLHDLEGAEQTIKTLHARLAKLDPPKQAAQIHHDLLRLVSLQAAFATDVVRLAGYEAKLGPVLAHVAAVGKHLQAGLKAKSAQKQAQAFTSYADALDRDAARMTALVAPAVALPSQQAEASRLRRTVRISRRISSELRPISPPAPLPKSERHNKAAVTKFNAQALAYQKAVLARRQTLSNLLAELGAVSSLAERRRVRAEQVKAVKAFDARLSVIGKLAARIQKERLALERKL